MAVVPQERTGLAGAVMVKWREVDSRRVQECGAWLERGVGRMAPHIGHTASLPGHTEQSVP